MPQPPCSLMRAGWLFCGDSIKLCVLLTISIIDVIITMGNSGDHGKNWSYSSLLIRPLYMPIPWSFGTGKLYRLALCAGYNFAKLTDRDRAGLCYGFNEVQYKY